jgi:hypothetical protein
MVHGAVLPSHLLVQENDHGIRLVEYSAAGHFGERLRTISPRYESFYPKSVRSHSSLTVQLDLTMSARCIVAILGGNPETGALPRTVPPRLAGLIQQVALTDPKSSGRENAWSIREELGIIANEVFVTPIYHHDAVLKLGRRKIQSQ